MENWIRESVAKWKADKVDINPGATVDEIEETERLLNFKFPDDFKQFYLVINGFNGWDMEEHYFTFYSLETIVKETNVERGDKNFIGFCDYLIASHAIGFKRNEKGIFKMYNETVPIASTFKEVISMINSGSELIY